MMTQRAALAASIKALLCLALMVPPAEAATIIVFDETNGLPLADAVVEVRPNSSDTSAPGAVEVIQRDAAFIPHVSHVAVGSQVRFPNRDTTRHHVYSFSPAKIFDLELYLHETPPPITFDTPGVVVLGCNIHDHMKAFIVISDTPHAAMTYADGRAEFANLPEGEHRLRIWHPRLEDSHQQWWVGSVTAGQELRVGLVLEGTPEAPQTLSPLQQRFRDATRQP